MVELNILDAIIAQASSILVNFILNTTIGFVSLVLVVHSFMQRASNRSLIGAWSVNVLGVFFHELAHAIVGLITYSKPVRFMIFPEAHKDNNQETFYTLGTVTHANLKWYNAFPSAMAPLLLLWVAHLIEKHYWNIVPNQSLGYLMLYVYLLIVFLINAIPSSIDFKEAFKNPFAAILWMVIIGFLIKQADKMLALF